MEAAFADSEASELVASAVAFALCDRSHGFGGFFTAVARDLTRRLSSLDEAAFGGKKFAESITVASRITSQYPAGS